jgi:hypothetical protein
MTNVKNIIIVCLTLGTSITIMTNRVVLTLKKTEREGTCVEIQKQAHKRSSTRFKM